MTYTAHAETRNLARRRIRAAGALLLVCLAAGTAAQDGRTWLPLAEDGIHDPKNPSLRLLQEPREALSELPGNKLGGDKIRWGDAIEQGVISPRTNIYPETKYNLRDTEILLNLNGSAGVVRFPHKDHTLWLDCSNCHDKLFKKEAGSNKYSKLAILNGEQCGVCHGAVAFPLTECKRCHSNGSRKSTVPAAAGAR